MKIPVAVLGATGAVGQRFVTLLADHPIFEIVSLMASERSRGQRYETAARWMMATPIPPHIASMPVYPCTPHAPCHIAFSALDSAVAVEKEELFAHSGYTVISNASTHRMGLSIPLLIPEINPDHIELIDNQRFPNGGKIVTNPNCSVAGVAMALKPLVDLWGVEQVSVVTLQAISGAGYPGVPSLDILDNAIPYIAGEEEKVESEPRKILGILENKQIQYHPMTITAQCNRVAVVDGHMACVSVKLQRETDEEAIIDAWNSFSGEPQTASLPSAPERPIIYLSAKDAPQPKLHRLFGEGMSVVIGRLRRCSLLGWKFVVLSHNTVRGAAGSALLNGELLVHRGYLS